MDYNKLRSAEARAWLLAAEQLDSSPHGSKVYLCHIANGTQRYFKNERVDSPPDDVGRLMLARIRSHDWGGDSSIPLPWERLETEERRAVRILACLWLALEAESDHKTI